MVFSSKQDEDVGFLSVTDGGKTLSETDGVAFGEEYFHGEIAYLYKQYKKMFLSANTDASDDDCVDVS